MVCFFDSPEAAYLRRTRDQDELWVIGGTGLRVDDLLSEDRINILNKKRAHLGLAVTAPRRSTPLNASRRLWKHLCLARVGFGWPTYFETPGIFSENRFKKLIAEMEKELERNSKKARKRETRIIRTAYSLGLNPAPDGRHEDFWKANCPGKNHSLDIMASKNEFFCGYCNRKGNVEELKAFVKERKS